jgi:pteridine reductase
MDLHGRVVLVTGGAKRIGRAIALRLAQKGASLAIHYRSSGDEAAELAESIQRDGSSAAAFQADLADPDQTSRLVPAVVDRLGRIDVLINNASVFEPGRLEKMDVDQWNRHLAINATAPMILSQSAWPHLRKHGGTIVNLLDARAEKPMTNHVAYGVSKEALRTLTLTLAKAMAPEVCVNGVAPGVAAWPDDYDEDLKERILKKVPLQRVGGVDDVATAVKFLVCDGDYITGQIIAVDGGMSVG